MKHLKKAILIALLAAMALGTIGSGAGAQTGATLRNEGVGIYTDASVAQQASGFTINPSMISCAVGTAPLTNATLNAGPFAMLMYSTEIKTYEVSGNNIKATGRMRSITQMGPNVTEDIEHDFIAHAVDGGGRPAMDRFDVHFVTPFWSASNAMCSRSAQYPNLCRFGGTLLMGDVRVAAAAASEAPAPAAPASQETGRLAQTGPAVPAGLGIVLVAAAAVILKAARRRVTV